MARHLPDIQRDVDRWIAEQDRVARAGARLTGREQLQSQRRCEEIARILGNLKIEQQRAKGLR
jgi:hypothetical protein